AAVASGKGLGSRVGRCAGPSVWPPPHGELTRGGPHVRRALRPGRCQCRSLPPLRLSLTHGGPGARERARGGRTTTATRALQHFQGGLSQARAAAPARAVSARPSSPRAAPATPRPVAATRPPT